MVVSTLLPMQISSNDMTLIYVLNEHTFNFRFLYQRKTGFTYLTITKEDIVVLANKKLEANSNNILHSVQYSELLPGTLYLLGPNYTKPVTTETLNSFYNLYYIG